MPESVFKAICDAHGKAKKLRRLLKFNLDSSPIYTQSAQSVPAALRIDGNAQDVWVSESSLIPQWQTKEPGPCYPAAVLGFASLITTSRAGDLNQKKLAGCANSALILRIYK